LAALFFYSGWSGWGSSDAAATAGIENKIIARLALREAQELELRFFKAFHCLDPQVLAVWETAKNIQFVLHGPSRPEISHALPFGNWGASAASNLKAPNCWNYEGKARNVRYALPKRCVNFSGCV